ncbi:MAG: peptidoglycan-binding protein, partial [Oscillospiraceae bacterium]|nr:peptidoglycan-binding protein [Oscillospiraceae bacterium]
KEWGKGIKTLISILVIVIWLLLLPFVLRFFAEVLSVQTEPETTIAPTPIITLSPVPTITPTIAPTASPVPTLKKGMNGDSVIHIQEKLIELGYLEDTADGNYGSKTEMAVERFQQKNGLVADGIVGENTLISLFSESALGIGDMYSAELNGRGHSDGGREEPEYVGQRGYIGYYEHFTSNAEGDKCFDTPWLVPTYRKDRQFWVEDGTIEHKTEVIVISQELKHEGYGAYSGMLLVERLDNKKQVYVNVMSFITKPYWTYSDLVEAVRVGDYIAEYNDSGSYYPVGTSNSRIDLPDGTLVLVKGVTGLHGRNGPDNEITPIEGMVWKEWKYGYGGVTVYFTEEDLTIVY